MLLCRLLASGIGTITVSLQYGIMDSYKRLWPQKGNNYNHYRTITITNTITVTFGQLQLHFN